MLPSDDPGREHDATCSADLDRLRSLTCIKWTRYGEDVIPAWVADMDLAPAPAIVEALRGLVERGDFGYNFAAAAQLPETFSTWEQQHFGWRPDPERTRVFCDVMQAVDTTVWLHTEPGEGVVLFTPVYHPFFPTVTSTGRRIVECPLEPDGWRIDPERLESVIDAGTRAILTCNPHNPTGRAFDAEELAAIADVAERHKLWLHIDAAYGGGFAMVPEYEWMKNGWELSDSIVINPHKTVFVPLDFSVLYVRDLERLRRVFGLENRPGETRVNHFTLRPQRPGREAQKNSVPHNGNHIAPP